MLQVISILIASLFFVSCNTNAQDIKEEKKERLSIGSTLPMLDYRMLDISGDTLTLESLRDDNGLLLVFSCNTCPFVIAYEDRYPGIEKICKENNIGLALINSNEARRAGDDSFSEMQSHAKEMNYKCRYLVDQNHQLADKIGAFLTPEIFLFDKSMKLIYQGAIDSNFRPESTDKIPHLANAIQAHLADEIIDPNVTKGRGCSIKRLK